MDLATSYLGLALRNPPAAAASPLSQRGKLALPPDTDQAAYQRVGYVRALQAANSARRPW